ncbi:MAG TPA: ABC transporter substrate-binding protein, partial [Dehalococcoidia bacterium]|nr:ABC transporter substrate-binding protein [Dehalococcoidia bacterium]
MSQIKTPQYGGTLTTISLGETNEVFDPGAQGQLIGWAGQLISEQLLGEDWAQGPAGNGKVTWTPNLSPAPDTAMGVLAESWEIPEAGTIVFMIRKGVHWALNPDSEASLLMNSREVTADDFISNFKYLIQNPKSGFRNYLPYVAETATLEKTGQWEITLKTPGSALIGWSWLACGNYYHYLLPPEVIEKYGDMSDWHNVVGTGPFMVTDLTSGSSTTLVRNPNYWGKDPAGLGKGNRLPYLDSIKILIIPDISTASAVFRTGQAEYINHIPSEGAHNFIHDNPEMKSLAYIAPPIFVSMKINQQELPFKDIRVRQALMMAIDYDSLKEGLYDGEAEILAFPVNSEVRQVYVPLDEMSEEVQ